MNFSRIHPIFLYLVCSISPLHAAEIDLAEPNMIQPDSVWNDSITNIRTHLQRPDTLTPYSCALHFFGKKPNGAPKLPGLQALVEDIGINALVLGWDHFVTDRDWARVTNASLRQNLTESWVWDNDSFSGNQFSHPFHGSMFYNAAREHGNSYGVSLLYPVVGSLTWEVFCETNRPAYNDLLSTGIGGAAFINGKMLEPYTF